MKYVIKNFENSDIGELSLCADVFGAPIRADIIARMVHWQLAKRRSGNHATKGISQISGTTRKPWRQKGTGRARAGSLRSPQFRGGATIFGPVTRDHGYDLPKKVRKLALKAALSSKVADGSLLIVDELNLKSPKTKDLVQTFQNLGLASALIIGGEEVNPVFARAASNIIGIDVLPQQGINVYDIMRRKHLVLTKAAVEYLENRLK